jgi:hypothetical protein
MSRSAAQHIERALAEVARKADSCRKYSQVLAYLSCELVGDLAVAWDRRRPLRFSVAVDGVPAPLPQELAALAFQVLQPEENLSPRSAPGEGQGPLRAGAGPAISGRRKTGSQGYRIPAHFGGRAQRIIELAERTVQYEQALLDGKVSAGELEAHIRRDDRNES